MKFNYESNLLGSLPAPSKKNMAVDGVVNKIGLALELNLGSAPTNQCLAMRNYDGASLCKKVLITSFKSTMEGNSRSRH